MKRSSKYAVTGGIGSGKSAVCGILRGLGYAVFSCDAISRELWQSREYLALLSREFPTCQREGTVDKEALSELVFRDPSAREKLNALSHPRIMEELFRRTEGHAISFSEVPLLFEGGYESFFDGVILVRRAEEERIRAVSLRDGLKEEQVRARISSQLPDSAKTGKNVFIIDNDGSEEELRLAVWNCLVRLGVK